jgi:XTP/dITP diphosphohydrolase
MNTLVFATQNKYKIMEISDVMKKDLPPDQSRKWYIAGLDDVDITEEIPETSNTLEGNALLKALYVFNKTGLNCFADDTGLEIDALKGNPGVYSARYAGPQKSFDDNIKKVLYELKNVKNRKARFRTVVALVLGNDHYFFEGIANGRIIHEKRGSEGFGYDPIFIPDGHQKTFAEMNLDEKNLISHRAIAVKKLIEFLKNH